MKKSPYHKILAFRLIKRKVSLRLPGVNELNGFNIPLILMGLGRCSCLDISLVQPNYDSQKPQVPSHLGFSCETGRARVPSILGKIFVSGINNVKG